MKRIPEFDGLRAIAVALVVVFHASRGQIVPGGAIGVDIFFVLSGYLITTLLVSEYRETGRISLYRFYVRRALRLMPALWLMLALVSVGWLVAFRTEPSWTAVSASALYYMNCLRAFGHPGQDWVLGHTWSLAIEEQFYLVWPLVLSIVISARMRMTRWVAWVFLIASVAAWPILLWQDSTVQRIYNGFDTRCFELFIGCLLAICPIPASVSIWAKRLWFAPIVALTVIALTLNWYSPILFHGGYHAVAALSAWMLISVSANAPFNAVLRTPALVYIGRISYGIYLFHYPMIDPLLRQGFGTLATVAIVGAASVILAGASYSLMERWFLRYSAKNFSADRSSQLGAGISQPGGLIAYTVNGQPAVLDVKITSHTSHS
ncbi:acyltransferase family protein [Bradyrhizobium sp. USDA 4502]